MFLVCFSFSPHLCASASASSVVSVVNSYPLTLTPLRLHTSHTHARDLHSRASGAGISITCSSRAEGVRARVGAGSRTCCYWDLHPRACV